MLSSLLFAPFADPARQAQYEAVHRILHADATAAPSVLLLGNLEVGGAVVDAVVVRPHGVTVLLFVPQGGRLDIPDTPDGAWQLDQYTLQGDEHAANPFEQFLRQQEALAAWLQDELTPAAILPELITGVLLFAGPVQFGPGVEPYLRRQPGAENFQLLAELPQLPRRLRQLSSSDINLPEFQLHAWYERLKTAVATDASEKDAAEASSDESSSWQQKARQLWRWLGAEDVPPDDAPYGSAAAAVAASQQEKERLEQLSQQVRAELAQQRQLMEARETERQQSIEQLRTQLNQAPATAAAEVAALQARLAAETREKNLLEKAIQASRDEAATRNQELDARIQQLGQLIEQLQQRPAPTASPAAVLVASHPVPVPPASSATRPNRPIRQLRWPRVALVVLVASGVGLGTWGLVELATTFRQQSAAPQTSTTTQPHEEEDKVANATPPSLTDIQPDTFTVEPEQASPPETDDNDADPDAEQRSLPRRAETHDTLQLQETTPNISVDSSATEP